MKEGRRGDSVGPVFDESRCVYLRFHIDTNRINARGNLSNMNQLERWDELGVINIEIPKVAYDEARRGGSPQRARKLDGRIYSYTYANTAEEQQLLAAIGTVLFPDGLQTVNDRRDVEIVFNAHKYSTILVTADGAILRAADELAHRFRVSIMTDDQAIGHVRAHIRVRDDNLRQRAADSGTAIPEWVGKD